MGKNTCIALAVALACACSCSPPVVALALDTGDPKDAQFPLE